MLLNPSAVVVLLSMTARAMPAFAQTPAVQSGSSQPSSSQCSRSADPHTCTSAKPTFEIRFGRVELLSNRKDASPEAKGLILVVPENSGPPADCKMVRSVDSQYRSPMPVARPDGTTRFPIRIVPVPSCRN
jgi:hypothetical protein